MSLIRNQKGAMHLVAIFAVLVVLAVGFGIYRIHSSQKSQTASNTPTSAKNIAANQKYTSKADLQTAAASLDGDANSNPVNPDQLDADLNSLL